MKYRVVILIFAFCFLGEAVLLAGGKEKGSIIEDKYLSGRKYFREGSYEAAVREFEEVIKMNPDYEAAAEYLKAAKAKVLAISQKENVLQEKFQKREEILQERTKQKEEAKAMREGTIPRMKEAWRRWAAEEKEKKEEKRRVQEEKRRIQEEKKRIKEEKKKELARLKREKELSHYYGLDELDKISQKSQEMVDRAEKKKTLQEEKKNKVWDKAMSLPSPEKEKAMARIYMTKAEAAYRDGDYDTAIKEWEKASILEPANSALKRRVELVSEIVARKKQIELEKARKESMAQAKEAVKKYCDRGKYLCRHKDYEGSLKEFQKALAIDPDSKTVQKELQKVEKIVRAKRLKTEKPLIKKQLKEEKAHQKQIQQISNLISKGNKYLGEKKFLKAKQLALKALELNPDSAAAKMLLENAERGLGPK